MTLKTLVPPFLAIAVAAMQAPFVRADFVVLKTGAIIEGKIYRQTDKFVYMSMNDGNGTVRFRIDEIDEGKTESLNYEENRAAKVETPAADSEAPIEAPNAGADDDETATAPEESVANPGSGAKTESAPAGAEENKDNHPLIPAVNQFFDALRAGDDAAIAAAKANILAQPNELCYAIVQRLHSAATPDEEQWAVDLLMESNAEKTEEAISSMLRDQRSSNHLKACILKVLNLKKFARLTPIVMKNEREQDVELNRAILDCLSTCRDSNQAVRFLAAYVTDPELGQNAMDSLGAMLDEFRETLAASTPAAEFDPIRVLLDLSREKITDMHKTAVVLLLRRLFRIRDSVEPSSVESCAPYNPKNDTPPDDAKRDKAALEKAQEHDRMLIRKIASYYQNDFKRSINSLLTSVKTDACREQTIALIALLKLPDYFNTLQSWILDERQPTGARAAAITAMIAYKNEDCYETLVEALRDKDKSVQRAAHQALVRLTGNAIEASYARWHAWLTKTYPNLETAEDDEEPAEPEEESEDEEEVEENEEEDETEEETAGLAFSAPYWRA